MSRVVLGKRLDGSYGLDVSLPGFDALTSDRNDATKFSFSSDWEDIVKYVQVGKVQVPQTNSDPSGTLWQKTRTTIPTPNQGFIPHFDSRGWDGGNRVYDDFFGFSDLVGVSASCFQDAIAFLRYGSATYYAIYVIYNVPNG